MVSTLVRAGTGEMLSDSAKEQAVALATELLEVVWDETQRDYGMAPLTALQVAQKITNAALAGAIKEHFDSLAEPYKEKAPKQTRMAGMD